ncbi:hypothetical protein MMH89_03840 [Candidatus Comchoanobacter bicostacola]|uniref:Uncharacterized protein n=1 Tax=Candidatus Comchoanobacter bicostacola TaxID=2919598 RepID=A0ABY5DKX5_9GAMM|nr:hypothetical protein [Candidatus Comchoanobacter bicostacola]UTC24349.1 hypothetical protein MMH89_03840 [Candidatus Comchoanobacter bicostacola]
MIKFNTMNGEILNPEFRESLRFLIGYLMNKKILKTDFVKSYFNKVLNLWKGAIKSGVVPDVPELTVPLTTFWWLMYAWYAIKSIFGGKEFAIVKACKKLLMTYAKNNTWKDVDSTKADSLSSHIKESANKGLANLDRCFTEAKKNFEEDLRSILPVGIFLSSF